MMPSLVPRLLLLLLLGLVAFVLDSGQAELNITWTDTSSGKRDVDGERFITTGFKGLARAIHAYTSGVLLSKRKRNFDTNSKPWSYDIPVIFDASYHDALHQNDVLRVIRFISSRTCLNIKDETSRRDSSNPNWFTQNGYTCNCYILVANMEASCSTLGTGPIKNKPTITNACNLTNVILHEFLHAFGALHEQQAPIASRYISFFYSAIEPSMLHTYRVLPSIATDNFDATTFMLYPSGRFSRNGDKTYYFIRDLQGKPDEATSNENVIFEELNKRYNCSTKACGGSLVDCYPGYMTGHDNVCACVCPPEFNSTTNCKTFKEGADKTRKWNIPISFFAGGSTYDCPSGFQPTGWFTHCGASHNSQSDTKHKYPVSGMTTSYPICSKTTPTENVDWNSIPLGGRYCFIKPKDIPCGGSFLEVEVIMLSVCKPDSNGSIGDITFEQDGSYNGINMKLCCISTDEGKMEINLPNEKAFKLVGYTTCPNVLDMRVYQDKLNFQTPFSFVSGESNPMIVPFLESIVFFVCSYLPAVYGCSLNTTLTATNRTVTITTPGYPGPRPVNTRCFYCFNGPPGSQFRVTFNDYDLELDDKMRIKPFHKWAAPSRVKGRGRAPLLGRGSLATITNVRVSDSKADKYPSPPPRGISWINNDSPLKQIVTESNYLCMEFWTGYVTNATNRGANFTVDLLLDSDSCYDTSVNGMDYVGTTNVSETNEPCLTWKEALNCYDFPLSAADALTGYYESNYCRNPGGKLLQPWCYVYRNDTSCMKRYCDVCNTKFPVDTLKTSDCLTYISQEKDFCQNNFIRLLCFKSCGMLQAPTNYGTCSAPPPVPSDSKLVGSAKASYKVGERVYVQCKKNPESDNSTKPVICTRNGWKGLLSACLDCPPGFTIYGDKCIYLTATKFSRPDALAFCNSLGRNGTLMHIRNLADLTVIMSIRKKYDREWEHSWFGAYLCNPTLMTWCFQGTSTPITYQNWDIDSYPSGPNDVVYLYKGAVHGNKNVKFIAVNGNTYGFKMTSFCQMDRIYPLGVEDTYSTCQSVLSDYPTFCKDAETMDDSAAFCAKSCGLNPATPKCSEPTSATYTRTSGTGPISTGDYMTFECNFGYFQTGGDASRACGLAGTLLGTAPVCDNNPRSMDMKWSLVRERTSTQSSLAFIMDLDGYRVPISGKLTNWYYFCAKPGNLYFVVYRKDGTKYKVIGTNHLNCTAGFRMSFRVPVADQIPVLAGDLVGAWHGKSVLALSKCYGSNEEVSVLNIPTATIQKSSVLLSTTSYPTKKCIIPSLGFRVEK